ncbi:MAG: VCBS repeat-containing protein, partial [Verrucomicrobiota bacterium]
AVLAGIAEEPGGRNPALVERLIEPCRQRIARAGDSERGRWLRIKLAQILLFAGRIEESVVELEAILRAGGAPGDPLSLEARDLLGVAHLRRGEVDNCIDLHGKGSCIVPIEPTGQHVRPEGSTEAIRILSDLLEDEPDRLMTRWLLNLAHMTLGQYPDRVPETWRLPPAALDSAYDIKRFPDLAPRLGLDIRQLSGGVILDDFNNDGYLDLVASSLGLSDPLRFFVNRGDGSFADQTEPAGLLPQLGGINLIHGDYDNDGFVDIYVLRGAWYRSAGRHPNSLLRNNGDNTFRDVTHEAGLLTYAPTLSAAWADFDLDGRLDLFVGNESTPGEEHPCQLFHNNGDGTFT